MKKITLLILLSLALFALASLTACGYEGELAAPEKLIINQDTLVLSWRENSYVKEYLVSVTDSEGFEEKLNTRTNSCNLENLLPGVYQIKVKALEVPEKYTESEWSSAVSFERFKESGLTYRLINSGTEYEVAGLGTASNTVVVDDTYRGRPVTAIATKAFNRNTILKSITLGANVTTISDNAFNYATALEEIKFSPDPQIPSKVNYIGAKAFQNCTQLKSVEIPNGVTQINERTFNYCSGLETVILGENVKSIEKSAFSGCKLIKSVTIPDSVTTIADEAFAGCSFIETLVIGNGVTSIGNTAFSSCSALTSVTMGNKVDSIGIGAFYLCSSLESINIPESVSSIGSQAFYGAAALNSVTGMDGVESIGQYAFVDTKIWKDASNFVYIGKWLVDMKAMPKDDTANDVVSGNFIKNDTVGIADLAMYAKGFWFSATNALLIPNSVKYIGYGAFAYEDVYNIETGEKYANNLGYVYIGKGVEIIGDSAFLGHSKLVQINIVDSENLSDENAIENSALYRIGSYAFNGCTALKKFDLPSSVTNIGQKAFEATGFAPEGGAVYVDDWLVHTDGSSMVINIKEGTVGIAEYAFFNNSQSFLGITMPDSVKYLNRAAFCGCTGLGFLVTGDEEEVLFNLSPNIEKIEEYTFYGCIYLGYIQDFELPENLTSIGRSAFYGTGVINVTIPDSVQHIDDYAFYNCELLATLTLGSELTSIGARAFTNCVALTSVTIPDKVETIGMRAFYGNTALETLILGDSLKEIGEYAFYKCENITALDIPASVETIGKYAFRGCIRLNSLTIGEGLKTLNDAVFFDCYSITNVYLPASLEYMGKYVFRNCKHLKSVTIAGDVETVLAHNFNGDNNLTIYATSESIPDGWNNRWNSSHRPVIWGVELSDEGYVVSFTRNADSISNVSEAKTITPPRRVGYTFLGWATEEGSKTVAYTAAEVANAPVGTTLYAIWDEGEIEEVVPDIPSDEEASDGSSSDSQA